MAALYRYKERNLQFINLRLTTRVVPSFCHIFSGEHDFDIRLTNELYIFSIIDTFYIKMLYTCMILSTVRLNIQYNTSKLSIHILP
jgi:hypothetical protein